MTATTTPTLETIVDTLCSGFLAEHGVDLRSDPIAMMRVEKAVAIACDRLASGSSAEISEPYISVSKLQPLHLKARLTRDFVAVLP